LQTGFLSKWPRATAAEVGEIEAGLIAERWGTIDRADHTDEELKVILIALWEEYVAELAERAAWILTDTFWDGDSWTKR